MSMDFHFSYVDRACGDVAGGWWYLKLSVSCMYIYNCLNICGRHTTQGPNRQCRQGCVSWIPSSTSGSPPSNLMIFGWSQWGTCDIITMTSQQAPEACGGGDLHWIRTDTRRMPQVLRWCGWWSASGQPQSPMVGVQQCLYTQCKVYVVVTVFFLF